MVKLNRHIVGFFKKSAVTAVLTFIGATVVFVLQAVFQPEIQMWAQEKRCEWVFDCEKQKASAFISALKIGIDIKNIKAA